jgi:hypothetical protein
VLVAGKGGGVIQGGRHVRHNRLPLANLFLSLLACANVSRDRIADSTGPLPGLA